VEFNFSVAFVLAILKPSFQTSSLLTASGFLGKSGLSTIAFKGAKSSSVNKCHLPFNDSLNAWRYPSNLLISVSKSLTSFSISAFLVLVESLSKVVKSRVLYSLNLSFTWLKAVSNAVFLVCSSKV
ncbi:hypothetical protein C4M81_04025, partial [Mycoplasmopsis pullorum]|uniref:hypothetical protein n=1 Tax=Mycoplasmopsis pullorum TaxID=48003 RepID=UPI0015D5997F